ncbi:MAG: flotillin-like protein FloA [Clostridia bacterium]|nr:flotillin-like protein FloA [Clostridia bacterium]
MNSSMLLATPNWLLPVIVGVIILVVIVAVFIMVPVKVWFQALVSGAHVSMTRLIGMKLRKVDYKKLVKIYIISQKAGLRITISDLETHLMAGGNIDKVVDALIAAHSARLDLTIQQAKAIDLAGRDVVEAVKTSVTPKVIRTPWVEAMAKNGIQVKAIAQVTVRARLDRQIGTADSDTILARVGEGIVTAIGQAATHTEILSNPATISKLIVGQNLDRQTAYEILSVDICDVDIGENLGAKLRIEDAEAKKRISQAAAEERKAQAFALEQEMKAKTQEMKAIVLAAESKVHEAMATAMKEGKFGVMDYYKMQNMVADTNMRNSLSNAKEEKDGRPPKPTGLPGGPMGR